MSKVTREHNWHQPKCGKGDLVYAKTHAGRWEFAKVMMVETHYRDDRSAYHSYHLWFDRHERMQWHGDKDIHHVVELEGAH